MRSLLCAGNTKEYIIIYKPEKQHKMFFHNLRNIDNRNKWKDYVIVTQVKLNLELDVLVICDQSMFIQF